MGRERELVADRPDRVEYLLRLHAWQMLTGGWISVVEAIESGLLDE